jgi:hypothetical protein
LVSRDVGTYVIYLGVQGSVVNPDPHPHPDPHGSASFR